MSDEHIHVTFDGRQALDVSMLLSGLHMAVKMNGRERLAFFRMTISSEIRSGYALLSVWKSAEKQLGKSNVL